jgi:ParB family chromosome partitioning protein
VFVDSQAATPRAVVYCTDPEEWGYIRTRPTSYVAPAVAAQREREQAERAARAQALVVAAGVRRDFLAATWATAKGAKTLHLQAMRQAMADPATITTDDSSAALLTRLAGCDVTAALTCGPDRLTRLLVARWLTAAEINLEDHIAGRSWRAQQASALAYLTLLTAHGYVLSGAERHLHDDLTAAATDQEPQPGQDQDGQDDQDDQDQDDPDGEHDEDDSTDPAADPGTFPGHVVAEQVA